MTKTARDIFTTAYAKAIAFFQSFDIAVVKTDAPAAATLTPPATEISSGTTIQSAVYNAVSQAISMTFTTDETVSGYFENYILTDDADNVVDYIGTFTIAGVLYHILGIMTTDSSAPNVKVVTDQTTGKSTVTVTDESIYFANNKPPINGDKINIAVQTEQRDRADRRRHRRRWKG